MHESVRESMKGEGILGEQQGKDTQVEETPCKAEARNIQRLYKVPQFLNGLKCAEGNTYRRRQSLEISRSKNVQGFVGHVMELGPCLAGCEAGGRERF